MGTKISKQHGAHSPSQDTKSYENVVRAYAKWEHHSGLVSHDIFRFANGESRNLKRHNQLSHNSSDQQKQIQPHNINQSPSNRQIRPHHSTTIRRRHNQNIYGKRLTIRKSQSMKQLSNSQNLITAEKLIKNQSQQRQRYRSSSSQRLNNIFQDENIQKSLLTTNTNQEIYSKNKTKQIPSDLQLVLINQLDLQVLFFSFHI